MGSVHALVFPSDVRLCVVLSVWMALEVARVEPSTAAQLCRQLRTDNTDSGNLLVCLS